jgi:hypothetical protein
MINQILTSNDSISKSDHFNTISFYIALFTAILTVITLGIAFGTPPLSGPFCKSDCFEYPYLNIASRFPRDYFWMYPAILSTSFYLILMACINNFAQEKHRIFGQSGLAFATISAATLILDYFLQISVIQPSILKGEVDGISLLSQFNPHGVFIALEEIGFIMMSTSFLCVAPIFTSSRIEKSICWIFILSFTATIIAFLLFTILFGVHREYYFEITVISINWLALIASSILLSIVFAHRRE